MPFRFLSLLPLLALPGPALAQGQESVASPMGPQTSAHPPPLLSTASVTSVPSGPVVPPLPAPVPRPEQAGNAVVLPGAVRLVAPARLFCAEIGDPRARQRCEGLREPPAPPAGGAP